MEVTINIPERIAAEAQERGVELKSYVEGLIEGAAVREPRPGFTRFGPGSKTREEAIQSLLTGKRYPLGDITIKELIEEGRRY
jgi:hypothetical protein